MRKLKSARTKR